MLLKIRHALLEVNNEPITKQSAITINNELVISSALILKAFLCQDANSISDDSDDNDFEAMGHGGKANKNNASSTRVIRKLQRCELLNTQEEHNTVEGKYLNDFRFYVTFDKRNLAKTIAKSSDETPSSTSLLTRIPAKLLYVFSGPEIASNLHKLFEAPIESDEILRSSFVVLTLRAKREKDRFERFLLHIAHYLRHLQPVRTLDDILVMCTPFGCENFYKTISIGKVANVIGRNGCLYSLSNPLPVGCEGSAVFNNKLHLVGIIMCTSFQHLSGNINLVLAADFAYILKDLMRQLDVPIVTTHKLCREPSHYTWERALVVIETNEGQGTGTFIKIHNKRFILTCAHVVGHSNSKVNCRSVDGKFDSFVIWRNPVLNQPFDVALLTAPGNVPVEYFVHLASRKPIVGQTVYNAGFPYFVNFTLKYDFNPSIFQGHIIRCDEGSIMSDGSVQAGQSGGPMFDQNGCIVGVCVSNLIYRDEVYPNINTAVPIYNIRLTLMKYSKTSDIKVLDELVANKEIQRIWSLQLPPIISKL